MACIVQGSASPSGVSSAIRRKVGRDSSREVRSTSTGEDRPARLYVAAEAERNAGSVPTAKPCAGTDVEVRMGPPAHRFALRLLQGLARVGHGCATFGPRSFRRRRLGVLGKGANWIGQAVLDARSRKAHRGKCRGGLGRERSVLLVDPVGALPLVGLEGLDGVSRFLHRAGHEAADGVPLPAHLFHDLRQRGAVLSL